MASPSFAQGGDGPGKPILLEVSIQTVVQLYIHFESLSNFEIQAMCSRNDITCAREWAWIRLSSPNYPDLAVSLNDSNIYILKLFRMLVFMVRTGSLLQRFLITYHRIDASLAWLQLSCNGHLWPPNIELSVDRSLHVHRYSLGNLS